MILEDPAKMKKLTQEEFEKVLNIAVLPEVYPLYHDVIKAHFGMRLQSFRKSGRSLTLQSSVLCLLRSILHQTQSRHTVRLCTVKP